MAKWPKFKQHFRNHAFPGDTIECKCGDWTYVARIERDDDNSHPEKHQNGFWPSRDAKSDGYVGAVSDSTFKRRLAHAKYVVSEWEAGRMFYVGVIIAVKFRDVLIADHAASMWGVECNWPTLRGGPHNHFLRNCANDLLDEAVEFGSKVLTDILEEYAGQNA